IKDAVIDWNWTEKQLSLLKDKNIDVIAGLVHHGSGPAFTNLLDDNFPYLLSNYARKVAEKFPWIEYYTPINEPLTTARFSGLYGLWYPHKNDAQSFIKILLKQLKAVVLSMQAIRAINPSAKLVQTEDLGKTYSSKILKYQADFENERRWLTYDFLTGKVNKEHTLWEYLVSLNIPEKDLLFFQENECKPDYFGFNYYVTSERFLDERLELYPHIQPGGNGKHKYVDVEAVRVPLNEASGIEVLLKEAWNRYRKPLAITEVHLHCHREEQLRWFKYVWNGCNNAIKNGVDIKAVTAWALLGSFGWSKLLTKGAVDYEPGVFDLRSGNVRPTALSKFIKEINKEEGHISRLSGEDGWWKRNSRYFPNLSTDNVKYEMMKESENPILIIGKNGTLGKAFGRICEDRNLNYQLLGRQDCNICDLQSIEIAIEEYKPWAILNTAGYVRVDDAEKDCENCIKDNTNGPENLAKAASKHGIKLVSYSSDLVFDGEKRTPYLEDDDVNPLNVYGRSKAAAEDRILNCCPTALVIRTSAFFGPWDEYNFVYYVRNSLLNEEVIKIANDLVISPTYVPDLVHATLDLLIDDEKGVWHLANEGELTWSDLAFEVADRLHLDRKFILPVPHTELNYIAKRPPYSVLSSKRGIHLPSLENALNRYITEEIFFRKVMESRDVKIA
ncbi:MAG TPA: family 1 glycosylhydrolase, partial [Flavisolibacter sp.]|nr:family 1 glycosylhydrolase [Flavisolibacter sp.]